MKKFIHFLTMAIARRRMWRFVSRYSLEARGLGLSNAITRVR